MSDKELIQQRVGRLRLTRRLQLVLDYLVRGLFWGAIPAALIILASRIWTLPANEYLVAGTALGLVTVVFIIVGAFRRISSLSVANDIDNTLNLKTRVSSALALSPEEEDKLLSKQDPFIGALVKDAARAVDKLPLKRVYPWSVPPAWKFALPALIIAAAMFFVPQMNLFASEEEQQDIKLVQETGKTLEELARQVEEVARENKDPQLEKMAEEVKRAGEKLKKDKLNKKEGLKELQRTQERLESLAKQQIPPEQAALTKKFGEELKKFDSTRELGEMLKDGDMQEFTKELEKLINDLKKGTITPEQMGQLKDMLKAIEESLESDEANREGAQEMKDALKQLGEAIKQHEQLQQQLNEAMNSFQQDLNKLNQELQQNNMGLQAQQLNQLGKQMQQQMAQNGMVNPQTMQQMQQQLSQAQQAVQNNQNLSPQQQQQLQQMIEQVQEHLNQNQQGQQSQQNQQQLGQLNEQMSQMRQSMAEQMDSSCQQGGG